MKLNHKFLDAFQALDAGPKNPHGSPPAKKLAYLLRPAFIAPIGKTFVWGDFSNIEARVLPWLANSPGAEKKLDIFRAVDKDKTLPDVYMRTASDLTGEDVQALWTAYMDEAHPDHGHAYDTRQAQGKVPELSLGFGGAIGALIAMATIYGVYLDLVAAQKTVDKWRAANEWARDFWGRHGRGGSYGLWGAANSAVEQPDTVFQAGRLLFVYDKTYLGGTLFMILPDGRPLVYPAIKWEWREVEDKKTKQLVDRYQLTFRKGYGRSALWYGKLAENGTQATAASILRRTMKRLDRAEDLVCGPLEDWMPMVMHTHDEIVTEVDERNEERARKWLREEMQRNDEWDAGLPLAADIGGTFYYTKAAG